jgi:hypothetical protein
MRANFRRNRPKSEKTVRRMISEDVSVRYHKERADANILVQTWRVLAEENLVRSGIFHDEFTEVNRGMFKFP